MPTPFLLNGILASQISGHLYAGPTGAFDALGSVTVGAGGQSSITFSAIPQTYTHLQIRGILRSTSGAAQVIANVNGDNGSNYSWHELVGNGSAASAGAGAPDSSMRVAFVDSTANTFAGVVIDLLDYANTNKNKTLRTLAGLDTNGGGQMKMLSGEWINTSAINSITLSGPTFPQYTSFALYGIR